MWRSIPIDGFPSIKEPQGILGSVGKRPNGLTLIRWQDGRSNRVAAKPEVTKIVQMVIVNGCIPINLQAKYEIE